MRFPTIARQKIHRPLVALHVHSLGRTTLTDALIDTGADVSIFPKFVADRLRIDLTNLPEIAVNTPLGGTGTYRLCVVELELRRSGETLRWKTSVGFTEHEMSYAFLGTKGFFEFFDLTYSARSQSIEIQPSADLPSA
jgi:hypothetical protein